MLNKLDSIMLQYIDQLLSDGRKVVKTGDLVKNFGDEILEASGVRHSKTGMVVGQWLRRARESGKLIGDSKNGYHYANGNTHSGKAIIVAAKQNKESVKNEEQVFEPVPANVASQRANLTLVEEFQYIICQLEIVRRSRVKSISGKSEEAYILEDLSGFSDVTIKILRNPVSESSHKGWMLKKHVTKLVLFYAQNNNGNTRATDERDFDPPVTLAVKFS